MFLTLEILEEKKACELGKIWMNKYFPNGGELVDIINHERVPADFLHWGYTYLNPTQDEKQKYWDKLNINCDNPKTIYHSKNIFNSSHITDSRHVENSSYISSSKNILNSVIVFGSGTISNSKQIFNSSMVNNSEKVYISTQINDSENILLSTNITNCQSVMHCNTIIDSKFIQGNEDNKCNNIINSQFIINSNNLKNCLFCSNLNDAEYFCFNQQIDIIKFREYSTKIQEYLNNWNINYITDWGYYEMPINFPIINQTDLLYKNLPQSFIEWICSLPEFDSNIWNQIIQ